MMFNKCLMLYLFYSFMNTESTNMHKKSQQSPNYKTVDLYYSYRKSFLFNIIFGFIIFYKFFGCFLGRFI